jgi:uncharacterized protein HemX
MTDTSASEKVDSTQQPAQTVHRNASWGAIISITIILAMVIVGAFYSWGQRIAEQKAVQAQIHAN